MNAEALIGKTLGTCTLQRLIGQGGMGTVFLAQQSRPRRQVAVKVLLPITRLSPSQHAAFLERFRRETDAAASLEHPNILPVHEYGEVDGLAYLVMPYISGGTLRDELERTRQLPLPKVVQYLDQIAAALDVAHARGVVHRDVKPANILMTAEGRLLLTDFGLVKVIAEDSSAQASLTGVGVPLGTPDYMAPEQVIGGEINARTDLYALGVVLFQMVTGRTPFKGAMPMQIAMQQINTPPPAPRSLREDLPIPAEQVILRAMAKKPDDRYSNAQDIASAFRLALAVAGIQLTPQSTQNGDNRAYKSKGLFDPSWQTGIVPSAPSQKPKLSSISRVSSPSLVPMTPRPAQETAQNDIVAKTSMTLPSFADFMPPSTSSAQPTNDNYTINNPYTPISFASDISQEQAPTNRSAAPLPTTQPGSNTQSQIKPRFVHRMSLHPTTNNSNVPSENVPQTAFPIPPAFPSVPSTPRDTTGNITRDMALNRVSPSSVNASNSLFGAAPTQQSGNTGTLGQSGIYPGQGTTTTMKLQQSFKVVQVPVAGQPGQFVTGFLPVLPQEPEEATTTPKTSTDAMKTLLAGKPVQAFRDLQKNVKIAVLLVVACLVIFSSSIFLIARNSSTNTTQQQRVVVTPNAAATVAVQATATMQANIILSDPLSENSHNWHVTTSGSQIYTFKDHAYHIINNDTNSLAIALLPDESVSGSYAYSLTMDALSGDETLITNQFGLVFNFGVHQKNGKTYKSFYIFEVANTKGGNYQLLKYDDGSNPNKPWTTIWSGSFGKEFHQGHGLKNTNTFKVVISGKKFTLLVNGKKVGDAQDGSLMGGLVGMLVNLNKTEVAFSNLLLTYK